MSQAQINKKQRELTKARAKEESIMASLYQGNSLKKLKK